jgi:uncharacterized protein (DUF697 family)
MSIQQTLRNNITQIENRDDLIDNQQVARIRTIACATGAGMAIQPLSFADIFILTPTQAYFATRIAAIRGIEFSESSAADWIKELLGIVGLGILAQNIAIAAWKVVAMGFDGWFTISLVYALTYAIMKICDIYFQRKKLGQEMRPQELRRMWKAELKKGKELGKGNANSAVSNKNL